MVPSKTKIDSSWHDAFTRSLVNSGSENEEQRKNSFRSFLRWGFPKRSDEEWKYTNLKHLEQIGVEDSVGGKPKTLSPEEQKRLQGVLDDLQERLSLPKEENWELLTLVEGSSQLTPNTTTSFKTDLSAGWEPRPSRQAQDGLDHLHDAFSKEKSVLRVSSHQKETTQRFVVLDITGLRTGHSFSTSHLQIEVGKGATAEIIWLQCDLSESPALRQTRLDISLEETAHLKILNIQDVQSGGTLINRCHAAVNTQALFQNLVASFSSGVVRNDLSVLLTQPGAECQIDGFYGSRQGGHIDNHTEVVHEEGNTESRQVYKGLLTEKGRGVFNGRVCIREGADGSSAHQLNKNVLLHPDAQIDTKPELQIDADDVSCSHGATVGTLSPEEVFYLRSRGLSAGQARELMASGFAAEIVQRDFPARFRSSYLSWLNEFLNRTEIANNGNL